MMREENSAIDNLEGGCACATVRYRLVSRPMFVHCCHCRNCQRQTGSAFVLNALIESDRVILLSGAPEAVAVPTDSGRPHQIYRCPRCGVAVWSVYGGVQKLLFVRVGTLDDPTALTPNEHIYVRSKPPGSSCPRASRPLTLTMTPASFGRRTALSAVAQSSGTSKPTSAFGREADITRANPAARQ
jgi:hypothetical protein